VLKSIVGGLIGGSVGLLAWFIFDENTTRVIPILIGILGVAAGIGLTLPGVSAKRVGKGVAVGMVAKPLPGPLRDKVFDALLHEKDEAHPQLPATDQLPPDGQPDHVAK
jgi:hypothetical protein